MVRSVSNARSTGPTGSPVTDREQLPEEHRHHFDHIMETRGYVGGPFGPLLNSPAAGGRIARLGTYIRYESVLPGPDRELAIIATGREFDCAFEWAAHEPIAREEGVDGATIEAVATRAPLEGFPPDDALVVRYVRKLLRDHAVSDEAFEAARNRYGLQGLTDLTATVGSIFFSERVPPFGGGESRKLGAMSHSYGWLDLYFHHTILT